MTHTKEPWEVTGLKPEWEFVEGVKTSNEGMTVDPAYLYHEPIETPKEQYARRYGYRLNKATGEYQRLTDEQPRPFKAEPSQMPVCDNVMEDGSVLIKKENVPKRLWKKVFGLSDAAEGRKG